MSAGLRSVKKGLADAVIVFTIEQEHHKQPHVGIL